MKPGLLTRQAVTVALALTAAFAAPVARAAEGERQLDPVLSLTGGCTTEAPDLVPDPGLCPMPPGVPGVDHPSESFAKPMAVTTDNHGDIYVSSFGKAENGTEGRIDIFNSQGRFIGEVGPKGEGEIPTGFAPTSLAVDSSGVLYVVLKKPKAENRIDRYTPSLYKPGLGEIEYGNPPVEIELGGTCRHCGLFDGIATNAANAHLFANFGGEKLVEYGSAEEGNPELRSTKVGLSGGLGVAVDAGRHELYAEGQEGEQVAIFVFDLEHVNGLNEYEKIGAIEGTEVPARHFTGNPSVAVNEGNGHVFVLDGDVNKVYEFGADRSYLATIDFSFDVNQGAEIGVDNGPLSPNGALGEHGRYLYVPSGRTGVGHSFAFEESQEHPPVVKSVSTAGIGEVEAELVATINPGSLPTTYTFEYTTRQHYEEAGNTFAGASVAGGGQLPAVNADREASAIAMGLVPGTEYLFLVHATNAKGEDAAAGSFATYPTPSLEPTPCPNGELRNGFSALLPDCRAYELVTPPDTNARAPVGTGHDGYFTNRQVSPLGEEVPFRVEGGSLPGSSGIGSIQGDPYLASRGPGGWSTAYIGPAAAETTALTAGGTSPDQGYSFWISGPIGPAAIEGVKTSYLRYPDGHSEILGRGSIGTDLEASGMLISEGAAHTLFVTGSVGSAVQLEPEAAPDGTGAIYDRTPGGALLVVSLLPGGGRLKANEKAVYQGASLDGRGVAFMVGTKLYLRYEDSETFEIGNGVQFAGVAEGGSRIFYQEGGRLWRFDALSDERTPFSTGAVTPVNISADGSSAYFVSTAVLTTQRNPNNAKAKSGQQNLYLSREGAISFVGILTARDVEGEPGEVEMIDGLGLWTEAIGPSLPGRLGVDPSRTTPDGGVLLFESRAPLEGYDPEGHAEIYRYVADQQLRCLSCNPTGAAAGGGASLQSIKRGSAALFTTQAWLANLRADGRRAFFQSTEPLVAADTDGLQDVYEWEEDGVGSCTTPGGCLYLISSAHSLRNEYLWAVSESGEDVFFLSSDLILPRDADETPSIYDARVGGGFPEPAEAECQGEGCRSQLTPAPGLSVPRTPVQGRGDNFRHRRCAKTKGKKARRAKRRCAKHHRHRSGSKHQGAHK